MRILYVYDGDWPRGATRVLKETRALAEGGHTVQLISRNSDGAPRREEEPWMTVRRLPHVPLRLLNYALNFPFFLNPVWASAIVGSARELKADCIVVCDLPLAPTAVWAGRRLGVPVHYDMGEVYPELLRSFWLTQPMAWSDHLVRNPRAAEAVERWVLPRVASVSLVSEESRARCERLGVPPERITIVGNTPEDVEWLAADHPRPADLEPWKGRPLLLFVGTIIGDRGLDTAIEALPRALESVPDAALVVVGDGPARPELERLAAERGLTDSVGFLGWRGPETLAGYYAHADVGLLPFRDTPHLRLTLANKLFDYMGAGLAVLASDLEPMRRVVTECEAGLLAAPEDPAALAEGAVALLLDPRLRARLGGSGQEAVRTRYRWSEDARRFREGVARWTEAS